MPDTAHSAIEITESTRIRRSTTMLTANVGSETVMMDPASERYVGLDDIGSSIWDRLDPPCTFGQLLDGLFATYDAERAVIAEDVRALLSKMAAHDLIELDPADSSA